MALADSKNETSSWNEERFERLLRLAAALQGMLPEAPAPQSDSLASDDDSKTRAKIESRAYEIFLERGATEGRALDDWLSAEREVRVKDESDPRLRLVLAFGLLKGL